MKKLLIALSLVLFISCVQEEEEEKRRLGDHTVSFYLNGKLWQNSKRRLTVGGINTNSYSFWGKDGNIHTVSANVWDKGRMYLSMSQRGENNIYTLGDNNGVYSYSSDPFDTNLMRVIHNNKIYLSKEGQGWAEITVYSYDTTNQIGHYEGIFEAKLFNEDDSTDIIRLTDGRWNN